MDEQQAALIFQMLRDLNGKVDGIASAQVTRQEFEAFVSRIDGSMVAKAEFQTTIRLLEDKIASGARDRDKMELSIAAERERVTALQNRMGRTPAWVTNAIIGVLSAITGGAASAMVMVAINHPHP